MSLSAVNSCPFRGCKRQKSQELGRSRPAIPHDDDRRLSRGWLGLGRSGSWFPKDPLRTCLKSKANAGLVGNKTTLLAQHHRNFTRLGVVVARCYVVACVA